MRVLSMGKPFFCDVSPVSLYRGPHEIRTLGEDVTCDFQFDPRQDSAGDAIRRIACTWAPDLLMCWMPEAYPPPFGVEHAPIRTVALVSDWNVYHPILAPNSARYDLFLCDQRGANVLDAELIQPMHAMPLYSAVTPIHRKMDIKKDIDVLFVGNLSTAAHPVRARYLERLARLSDRYRIVLTGGAFGDDYARLLNRARLVFNHSIRGELNLRVFETLACGSTALLESGNLEVRGHVNPGEEIVLYDADNFEDCIAQLLEHPEKAQEIADAGHARASEFAGENRLTALIDWIANAPGSGRPFCQLPEHEQRYRDILMYGQSRYAGHGEWAKSLLPELMDRCPDDPRVWSITAQIGLSSPGATLSDEILDALERAHACMPESAVLALNAALGCAARGDDKKALGYLSKAVRCESSSGETCLLGPPEDAFVIRWRRSVAERTATIAMVHAEAHIRMANILAAHDDLAAAEEHLRCAEDLDAENTSGVLFGAELLWKTGRKSHAAERLYHRMADLPLSIEARQRLCDMLAELGLRADALALARETMQIMRAFVDDPATV
ncbi:MAG: glycosyltransferase [Candidatus Hydrogenedentes bacterium]|nr:glycosyltransferase [Candidatus Hydrogenedentota bacterium]